MPNPITDVALPSENPEAARRFVAQTLQSDDFEMTPYDSQGYRTRVYECASPLGSFILRHGNNGMAFSKDRFVAQTFASSDLPIPPVLGVAKLEDKTTLCLSEKIQGHTSGSREISDGAPLMIDLNRVIRAIHTQDVSATHGYGFARGGGMGMVPGIASGVPERIGSLFWQREGKKATTMDQASFRDMVDAYRHMREFRITERRLCHGDIKRDNFLVVDDEVTAVIDWARFGYHDPAYDLGILHMRYPGMMNHEEHSAAIGLTQRNLRERILYYALGECIVSIGFFGKAEIEDQMIDAEKQAVRIVDEVESL